MGICDGRVVIVTGGGRGLGREYALAYAAEGARVVVNDLGGAVVGGGSDKSAADAVAEEIRKAGGEAIANHDDVADWDGAGRLVDAAIAAFGKLDTVVNNAGILKVLPFGEHSLELWDATIRVHLRGHYCVIRRAYDYWKAQRSAGNPIDARVVNITSNAGLQGAIGEAPYATAKGGIASLTLSLAAELAGDGIVMNAVAPTGRTRMTVAYWPEAIAKANSGFDYMDPAHVAPMVVWLGSDLSGHVTGQIFEVGGGSIALADGWDLGPVVDRQRKWEPAEIGDGVALLMMRRRNTRPPWA